jgi:uncharacterized sodium:solute symporter family permease YidK
MRERGGGYSFIVHTYIHRSTQGLFQHWRQGFMEGLYIVRIKNNVMYGFFFAPAVLFSKE